MRTNQSTIGRNVSLLLKPGLRVQHDGTALSDEREDVQI